MGMTNDVRVSTANGYKNYDVRSTRCEWYEDLAWGAM